jgi:hypothetical protein
MGGNGRHGRDPHAEESPDEETHYFVVTRGGDGEQEQRRRVHPAESLGLQDAGCEVVAERVSMLEPLNSFRDVYAFFVGNRDTTQAPRMLDGVELCVREVGQHKLEAWTQR